MATIDDDYDDGGGQAAAEEEAEGERSDTIARRTRTKLSLVDVPIDELEGLLPETAEPVRGRLLFGAKTGAGWRQNAPMERLWS